MKWAREKARYDIATAARKIGRPASEIEAWENGSLRPTLAQARKVAEVYRRSLAVLYLPEPPTDFDTLRDFRRLPRGVPREYSPELALLVRQLHVRQEWLREFLRYQGAGELPFVGSASPDAPVEETATSIREQLGVSTEEQTRCRGRGDALRLWIDRTEDGGIAVCRQGTIECEEARGLVLADAHAPFVYLNSSDALAGQLFTLLHELAHLWLGCPGISNLERLERRPRTQEDRIEAFCNRLASHVLLEDQPFWKQWESAACAQPLRERVEGASRAFKVGEEVVARRLMDRSAITRQQYRQLRSSYAARWQEHARRRRGKSGGDYYHSTIARNSRHFTCAVIEASSSGAVTILDASALLRVKANHLPKLAAYAGVSMGVGIGAYG